MGTVISIGNSKGVIIPNNLLKNLGIGLKDKVLIELRGVEIIIKKATKKLSPEERRKCWVEQINKKGRNFIEDPDLSDWKW